MGPRLSALAITFLSASLFFAGSALAQDRPDLLDASGVVYAGGTTHDSTLVTGYLSGAGGAHSLLLYFRRHKDIQVGASATDSGTMRFKLYEPDKLTRKANGNKTKQSDYASVAISIDLASTASFSVVGGAQAGCKVKFKHKQTSGGFPASWTARCGSGILDDLGLTAAQKTAFNKVFGSSFDLGGKSQ